MRQETSCIHPFIRRTRHILSGGGSFTECLKEIPEYQRRVSSVYKVNTQLIHALTVSSVGLTTFVAYEYLRHKGLPFPDSLVIINKITPFKVFSERLLLGEPEIDPRHSEMEKKYQL